MKLPPEDVYRILCHKLRNRIEFSERVLSLSDMPISQVIETVSLQGRKCVEAIAFLMLVSTHNSGGQHRIPKDAKTHWNAERIFERYKKLNMLSALPSPSLARKSEDPAYKIIFEGVPAYRLSFDDLIKLYRKFHRGVHEPNPYVHVDDDDQNRKLHEELAPTVSKIRSFVWSHAALIDGRGFMVVFRDDNGKMLIRPLQKQAELPPEHKDN
jgi:hypothetical protein